MTGKKADFSQEQEDKYFQRGKVMLARATASGPCRKGGKLNTNLPQFGFQKRMVLYYVEKLTGFNIWSNRQRSYRRFQKIKSKKMETHFSCLFIIFLPIISKRPVVGMSYWYLVRDELVDGHFQIYNLTDHILKIAKHIKLARALERFICPGGEEGCRYCKPFEQYFAAKRVCWQDAMKRDVYIMNFAKDSALSGGEDREEEQSFSAM